MHHVVVAYCYNDSGAAVIVSVMLSMSLNGSDMTNEAAVDMRSVCATIPPEKLCPSSSFAPRNSRP